MNICYEKARELGDMIRSSDLAVEYSEAYGRFSSNPAAVAKMNEFEAYRTSVNENMTSGELTQEEFTDARKSLTEMIDRLKNDEITGRLIAAENQYNMFVNQVLDVLKSTITGEDSCGNCGGGCPGCGGR